MDGEDLDVRVRPYEPLHFVEHLLDMAHRGGDCRHSQVCPLPRVLVVDLGRGDAEAALGAFDDRFDGCPLLLERVAQRDVQFDAQYSYVRGISRSS